MRIDVTLLIARVTRFVRQCLTFFSKKAGQGLEKAAPPLPRANARGRGTSACARGERVMSRRRKVGVTSNGAREGIQNPADRRLEVRAAAPLRRAVQEDYAAGCSVAGKSHPRPDGDCGDRKRGSELHSPRPASKSRGFCHAKPRHSSRTLQF